MFTDSELTAILSERKQSAKNFRESEVETKWALAKSYYDGELFGGETKDRSQVVLTEVRDKIQAVLPSLMKIFTASDEIVKFNPTGEEDVELAEEATDYVHHIFKKDNNGFLVLYTAFADGLLYNNGITKTFVEDVENTTITPKTGVFADELQGLFDDPEVEVEIIEEGEVDTEIGPLSTFDIEVSRKISETLIRVENVPVQDFYVDGNVMRIPDSPYCAHDSMQTRSNLIKMGFSKKDVADLPTEDKPSSVLNEDSPRISSVDASMDEILLTEHYLLIDMDGKGVGEPWMISTAGNIILGKERWDDDWPFQSCSPILNAHEFYGTSLAEEVFDIQTIKSTVMRMLMDNTYSLSNNRLKIFETQAGQVNIQDVLNKRPDSPIRIRAAKGMADVEPLPAQPIGQIVMPVMEFLDGIAEVRTGVTKFGQGLDADVLQRSPATGVSLVMTAAQEKQLLIARVFAETGVKDIFTSIYRLARKYQSGERILRLRGKKVTINPGNWEEKYDLTVKVGLGTGNHAEKTANAQMLLSLVEKGLPFGYVTKVNGFNAIRTAVESLGFPAVEQYFTDPRTPEGEAEAKKRTARKSENEKATESLVQVEMAKIQERQATSAAKQELEQQKFMHEMKQAKEENRLQIQEMITKFSLERQELVNQTALKMFELNAQMEVEGTKTGIDLAFRRSDALSKDINVDTRLRAPDV